MQEQYNLKAYIALQQQADAAKYANRAMTVLSQRNYRRTWDAPAWFPRTLTPELKTMLEAQLGAFVARHGMVPTSPAVRGLQKMAKEAKAELGTPAKMRKALAA